MIETEYEAIFAKQQEIWDAVIIDMPFTPEKIEEHNRIVHLHNQLLINQAKRNENAM